MTSSVTTAITLFGATGYTGQLIARALSRAGLEFRIAGRSAEKLQALSESLPGKPAWLVADTTQTASLPPLFQNTRLLINCAGPFTDLGERVIAQAAMSGVHYLDTTNELGYVFRARTYSQMGKRTGAALVPACGFEVALADCAAQIAGEALLQATGTKEIESIDIVYTLNGKGASAGTRRSAVRSLATSWVAYREGTWTGQIPGGTVRRFDLPGGARHALSFPSCETVTVPLHLPLHRVDTWMTTTPGARFWAPVAIPIFARLSRSILRGLFLRAAAAGGISPAGSLDVGLRADSPFLVYAAARQSQNVHWVAVQGQDPYGLTAEIITYAARQMTAPDYAASGLVAPSMALDPRALLDYAKENWGMNWSQGAHA